MNKHNKEVLSFSLDHNCWIYFENKNPQIFSLIDELNSLSLQYPNKIKLATCAIHASENQKQGELLRNIQFFIDWLNSLNINIEFSEKNILKPIAVYDLTFWGYCLYSGAELDYQLNTITNLLTPVDEFKKLSEYYKNDKKFRNKAYDILSLDAAIRNNMIFVSENTKDFQKVKSFYPQALTISEAWKLCYSIIK